MSFFGNLNGGGIKGPDVVINGDGGSLLPTSSSGLRFSSAQINKQDSLLSGINPYDYGQGSVSDDIAYQVTPHKIQKIVPEFSLPSCKTTSSNDFSLSHSVSDGDLAFTIRIVHDIQSRIKNYNYFSKQNITRAVDPIINLATVNYILRGLQSNMGGNQKNWDVFLQATGWPIDKPTFKPEDFRSGPYQHRNISMFIQDYIRPLGVVIGSDMQGGQHQPGGSVDFPVDFVVTILVDGLCDNMLNLWRRTEIRAGSDLLLALVGTQVVESSYTPVHPVKKYHPVKRKVGVVSHQVNEDNGIAPGSYGEPTVNTTYVLNHWAQGQITQQFEEIHLSRVGVHNHEKYTGLVYELVPTTSSEIDEGSFLGNDKRNRGLWHIARSQVMIRGQNLGKTRDIQTFRNDKANLAVGGLVQATIAPSWKSAARCLESHRIPNIPSVCHTNLDLLHVMSHVSPLGTVSSVGTGGVGSVGAGGVGIGVTGGVKAVNVASNIKPLYSTGVIARPIQSTITIGSGVDGGGIAKRKALTIMGELPGGLSGELPGELHVNDSQKVTAIETPAPQKIRKTVVAVNKAHDMEIESTAVEPTQSTTFARNITTSDGVSNTKPVSVLRVAAKKRGVPADVGDIV
jgi:hypothetical protein